MASEELGTGAIPTLGGRVRADDQAGSPILGVADRTAAVRPALFPPPSLAVILDDMNAGRRRTPRLTAVAVAGTLVVVIAFGTLVVRGRPLDVQYGLYLFHNGPPAVLLMWLGRLVLRRQPGNRIGAVLMIIAALGALHTAVAAIADIALVDYGYVQPLTADHPLTPAELPLSASVPLWIMNWLWVPQVVLVTTILPLLFPDGRLPGPRWRVAPAPACLAAILLLAATIIDGWPAADWGVTDAPRVVSVLFVAGGATVLVSTVIALSAVVARWRAASEEERGPFRIVGVSASILGLTAIATYPWQGVWIPATLIAAYQLFAAYALAVARFRLHDVEPVLGKEMLSRAVSVVAATAFLAAVIGLGIMTSGHVLSVIGVALAAVVVLPLYRLARRVADRYLLGRRHDRASVVSRLAAWTAETPGAGLVQDAARLLLRGTGAQRVEICLEGRAEPVVVGQVRSRTAECTATITYAGQLLGRIHVHTHAAGDLPADAKLLIADVSHILGVTLHNQRLSDQLRDHLDELQASRRRLVQAHDEARRLLERDLHDGAQAELIAVRLRIGALQAQTGYDGLAELATAVDDAIDSLRELARGVHPPILDQAGPGAAIAAQARRLTVPVTVTTNGQHRYEAAAESAVYFAALEAIQNAVRHGHAGHITVTITQGEQRLAFEVSDDGRGFDPATAARAAGLHNLDDRIGALGGQVTVVSSPGQGTTVAGAIPARPLST